MRVLACSLLLVALTAAPALADQTHIVQPGETLWVIASRHGIPVSAIARANRLSDINLLQPGQRLVIPSVSGSTSATTKSTAKAAARVPAARLQRYEVKAGDTLWTLARRFDMRVKDLAALNGIAEESTLRIGQVLKIRAPAAAPLPARPAPALRRPGTLPYRGEAWAGSLIGLARRFIGTPYRWGATGPSAFDCSGFLQYVYARTGVALPRTTFAMYNAGRPVPAGEVKPGDMVFFTTYRPGPSHAGIYLGNGNFIHSSSGYGSVTITPLSKPFYRQRYLGARRF